MSMQYQAAATLVGLRRKPWSAYQEGGEAASDILRGMPAASTALGRTESQFVKQVFDEALRLLEESDERHRVLRDVRERWALRKGDLPDAWGVYGDKALYLDHLLVNPENRLELLRTLLFVSGAGLGESDQANERFVAEVTSAQRLPRPERRGETVEAVIAGGRAQWEADETLQALGRVPVEVFGVVLELLAPRLYRNHLLLNDLRRKQLDILPRLARLPGCHFDSARETLGRLFAGLGMPADRERLHAKLRGVLLPELVQRIRQALIWDLVLNRQTVETVLAKIDSIDGLRQVARALVQEERGDDGQARFEVIERLIRGWLDGLAEYADAYVALAGRLDDAQRLGTALVEAAAATQLRVHGALPELLEKPLYWLFSRVYQVPHLKSLDQPMLVLLAGIPRSGSRFVAKRLSQELSIRTFFTTNQVREAIRGTYRWAYGQETAEELYPELFGSPLEPLPLESAGRGSNGLDTFYVQALITVQGLTGALSRLVKEGTSAIIEGVHVVPGLIDERLYQRANIVTLILGYAETPEHLPARVRDDSARMERRRETLRRINERVVDLAHHSEMTVVHDPGEFEATMGEILHRVRDTVADRGIPPLDPILRRIRESLDRRRQGICRKSFRVEPPSVADEPDGPEDTLTLAHLEGHRATLGDASALESDRLAAAEAVGRILTRLHDPVALVFDMGGVLVRGHNAIFTRRYAAERLGVNLDDAQLSHVHHCVFKVDDAPYRKTTRGEASPEAFARHMLDEILQCRQGPAGAAVDKDDAVWQRDLLQRYYDHYEEIGDNTQVIARLRDRSIAVFGLTNNFVDKVVSIQGRIPLIRGLPMVISDVARARKPHRRIFQYLVRLLQLTRGANVVDMDRVLFFDDKQDNLDGAYRHFGFYGINYDANRNEHLSENPEIREILGQDLLRETRQQVQALAAAPAAHGLGDALAAALDDLVRRLDALQVGQTETAPALEPGETKIRDYLRTLGLRERVEQTPIADFALGTESRTYVDRHRGLLLRTRESLVALRTLQYQVLSHMVNVPDGDYDLARRDLAQVVRHIDEYTSPAEVEHRFSRALFGELKWFLTSYLAERELIDRRKAERCLTDIRDYAAFKTHQRDGFGALLGADALDAATRKRIDAVVAHIEEGVGEMARKYLHLWGRWYIDELNEMVALMDDGSVRDLVHGLSPHAWHAFVRWLFPRVARIPHIKNLAKPTVVLITGTSGTGKSSVAQHIAHSLAIPIYFSTDVVAREVVRSTLGSLLGPECARRELPELYGSSFALPEDRERVAQGSADAEHALLDWYYGHAMLTMIGVQGILDRLLATDNSAVIEGVPLVPGFLPEHYFERVNIVWVVTTIENKETHFARYAGRDVAGVDRGGAVRYRQRFDEIRLIHDRLEMLGRQAGCTVVDNMHGLGETAELALDRIENFYAARGLPIADPDRDRVRDDIETRRRRIWSERLLGRVALGGRASDASGAVGDQPSR